MTIFNKLFTFHFSLFTVYSLLFIGCIATTKDVSELKDDMYQIKTQFSEVQKNQASVSTSMDSLNTNITALTEKLEDNKTRMSLLAQRMDDTQASLSQRMDLLIKQLSGNAPNIIPAPTDLYKLAYSDYSRGKYDLAIVGFRTFIDKYPTSELAASAQFYLSENYFSKKDYANTLTELDKFFSLYPKSNHFVSAKYRQAICYKRTEKRDEAKSIFESIINEHPTTPEAEQSKKELAK